MHSAFRFALLASSALLLSACATQGSDIGNALAGHSFTWDASAVAQAEQAPSLAFSEDGRVSGRRQVHLLEDGHDHDDVLARLHEGGTGIP